MKKIQHRWFVLFLFCLTVMMFGQREVQAESSVKKRETSAVTGKHTIARNIKICNSKEEMASEFAKHLLNFDRSFTIYVSKNALPYYRDKPMNDFWEIFGSRHAEAWDIYWTAEIDSNGNFFHDFGTYWKWEVLMNEYKIEKKDVQKLNRFVKKWVKTHIRPNMSAEKKIRTINDYMIGTYKYSFGDKGREWYYKNPGKAKIGRYSVYTSFAVAFKKGGVCNGKANLFYRLAKASGIQVRNIIGYAGKEYHAWNLVKVGKNWYHVDVTWGRLTHDGNPDGIPFNTREYYMKGDRSMRKAYRTWVKDLFPKAKKDYPNVPPAPVISGLSSVRAS